ncbi:MAG: septum formation initiator family protein [Lachnospiraceae bacterium]|nr:septum formation initiator family protein [Lachnospiraceae bacterium]
MAGMRRREEYRTGAERRTRLYVDGTTVRREELPRKESEQGREEVSRQVRKNRERALHMTAPYVLMLAAAVVVMLVVCCQYLQLQSDIVYGKHTVTSLTSSIEELKTQNDATEDSIEIYTDLEYIYEVATSELGMVYPSDNQIILYDKEESEYVRQYEDIPTDD